MYNSPSPTNSFLSSSSAAVTVVSKWTVYPDTESTLGGLKLSVSDLPMLSCHYIQKGVFFPRPPIPFAPLLSLLKSSLSRALSLFPALAGRLSTLPDGRIIISCNDAGADFSHAIAPSLTLPLLLPTSSDVPLPVKSLFPFDGAVSYQGHFRPLAAFQVTELGDGAVFIGCVVNHAILDGTSFWNFFNTWAELCRGATPHPPDLRRNFFGDSTAVLRFADGDGPKVTFPVNAPLRERIFHFSREAIRDLKSRANAQAHDSIAEIYGKQIHDPKKATTVAAAAAEDEVSSFQSLCAQLWRAVTRSRKHLRPEATTTFRMAVNCRHRVVPPVDPSYFGNAIQSIPTTAAVGEVAARKLRWAAGLLHGSVAAHGDETVRRMVAEWEAAPRCFPLGNPDGAGITMGSSHRFPVYEGNDFGWGLPLAVRSGRANKFDGKISAFPGREGGGSVDLEVCLSPDTMAALLQDDEFMHYVSQDYPAP
ncbi:putative acetyltransferase [Cocos nucifera]|nr:putative acetyltransferase [Cocos nucifera]